MRIIQLKTENVKKVKAIEITPKTDVVIISGNNGQGKTSVLDSIWYALQGKTGLKGTPMPIRKGEKKASVVLTLDEFVVTRTWTDNNKSYLKVTNREGLTYNSPQELLDGFIGELTFDPLEFANMKNREQRDLLLKLVNVDIDSLDVNIEKLKELRRLQGHKVKLYEGERDTRDFSEVPEQELDVHSFQKNVEKAIDHNRDIDATKEKVDRIETVILNTEAHLLSLEEQIKDTKQSLKTLKTQLGLEQKFLGDVTKIDIELIRANLNKALEINELVQARQRNFEADKKQRSAQTVYDTYTKDIESFLHEKTMVLREADMPIKGLTINDTGISFNDIPFSQLSSSEQLTVSLCIAMAINPKLRVIRITNGSLLDDLSMAIIKKYATDKKYQIWVEKVDGSGTVGFYIEEGEIVDGKNDNA